MAQWDGKTERRSNANDHDNITRMLTVMENHVKNFDAHVKEDKASFDKIGDKISNLSKFIYIGIGIVAVLQFILKH